MRALVTGGGGFSGRRLVTLLEERGIEVHTLGTRDLPRPRHHQLANLTDRQAQREVIARVGPDRVFHLAGVSHAADSMEYYRVNLGFCATLIDALEDAGFPECPTLIVGTSAEYGQIETADLPITETLPARPYSHYGISKLAQTLEGLSAARRGRPVVVARPFNLVGPGMPRHLVIPAFARQLAEVATGRQPPIVDVGNLDATRDFLHVDDAVAAYQALLDRPGSYGQVVNVCSGVGTSIRQILAILIRLAGVEVEVRTNPSLVKPVDIPAHFGSVTRLHQLVGPLPSRSLEASLREVLSEALENP